MCVQGSTVGRTAEADEKKDKKEGDKKDGDKKEEKKEKEPEHKKLDPNKIYKDLDFTRGFCFGPIKAKILFDQMASDLKVRSNCVACIFAPGLHALRLCLCL